MHLMKKEEFFSSKKLVNQLLTKFSRNIQISNLELFKFSTFIVGCMIRSACFTGLIFGVESRMQ